MHLSASRKDIIMKGMVKVRIHVAIYNNYILLSDFLLSFVDVSRPTVDLCI